MLTTASRKFRVLHRLTVILSLRRIRDPSARRDELRILRLRSQARFAQDDTALPCRLRNFRHPLLTQVGSSYQVRRWAPQLEWSGWPRRGAGRLEACRRARDNRRDGRGEAVRVSDGRRRPQGWPDRRPRPRPPPRPPPARPPSPPER